MNVDSSSWVVDGLNESELLAIYANDHQYAHEMFLLYHDIILPEINASTQISDPTAIKQIIHKQKTSVAHVGLTSTFRKMEELETAIEENRFSKEELIKEFQQVLREMMEYTPVIVSQIRKLESHV